MDEPEWLKVLSHVLAAVAMVLVPVLAKRNARAARIIEAVILGVEDGDSGKTKTAIRRRAEEAGVQPQLDKVVQKNTPKELPHDGA